MDFAPKGALILYMLIDSTDIKSLTGLNLRKVCKYSPVRDDILVVEEE